MNKTKIEWTTFSWNPVSGCKNDCPYCYARSMYKRFGFSFEPALHPERLNQPRKKKKGSFIFVCSVADLFGDWVPLDWIEQVFDVIRDCPQHIFMLLTKCPQRLPKFSYPPNVWLGCTATDQTMADKAMRYLPQTDAQIKFLSCEPLLKPLIPSQRIDWLIIGGCTHPKPFQPQREWVEDLLSWADGQEPTVPIFMKNNLKVIPKNNFRIERPLLKPAVESLF